MKRLMMVLILLSSYSALAGESSEKILKLDPYSMASIEQYFPKAVTKELVVNENAVRNFKKNEGPLTKEKISINYEVLIPELIMVIKEQQKEIQQLKENLAR